MPDATFQAVLDYFIIMYHIVVSLLKKIKNKTKIKYISCLKPWSPQKVANFCLSARMSLYLQGCC